ncbi:MAG: hypothetical protein JF586_19345 [Burkholderiales bacterium]|nr:hypothetical protein [Burkholderiales bacterium]
MHVEPLEKLPRSVREFLSHYSMIVLSILTALALEQVALRIEHRHEGQRAKEEIEQEITSNQQLALASLRATRENAQAWEAVLKRTLAQRKDGSGTNESRMAALHEAGGLFRDAMPSLKTTAWDSAISDHSVNYLGHDDLTRYSQLYAFQRSFSQALWDTLRDSAVRDVSQLSLALLLEKAEPEQTIATLNSRMRTIEIMVSQLRQLEQALREARQRGEGQAGAAAEPAARGASH